MSQIHYRLALTRRDELLRHAEERRRVDQAGRSPDLSSNVPALVRRLKPAALRFHRALRKRAAEHSHDRGGYFHAYRALRNGQTRAKTRKRLANER